MSAQSNEPVELEVIIISVRSATVQIELADRRAWLPRHLVDYSGELEHCQPAEVVEISVPHWLAYQQGLI